MIRGVIFDLGNTLMYWDGDGQEIDRRSGAALLAYLRANGVAVGEEFLPRFRAERERGWLAAEETNLEHTVAEALANALAALGQGPLDGLLDRSVEHFFVEGERYQQPYPGAVDALLRLHDRGLRVGMISNADDDGLVQRAVVKMGFGPYLDPVVSSAGLRWRKPNPDIFAHVASRWHLDPGEIAMVGDAPRYDILGAHNAGMLGILIDRGEGHSWQQIPAGMDDHPAILPDATVKDLRELMAAIDSL